MAEKLDVLSDTDNIEQKIGEIGFQSGMFEKFIHVSKAGKELLDHIVMHAQEKEKEKEDLLMQYIEIIKQEAKILQRYLEESDSGKVREQEEYQAAALVSQQLAKSALQTPKVEEDKASLLSELSDVTEEIGKKEKLYKDYESNIQQAEDFIEKLPPKKEDSIEALKAEIARLEGTEEERNAQADEVFRLVDAGKEQEARALMDKQNAKNTQVGALKDMLAVVEGTKKMYKADGTEATSFKEAQFIVPAHQKLEKVGDQYYLLKSGDTLSEANKEQAAQNFERHKNELVSVRSLISSNKSIEMMGLGSKIDNIKERIEALPQVQAKQGLNTLPDTHDPLANLSGQSVLPSSRPAEASGSPTATQQEDETAGNRMN